MGKDQFSAEVQIVGRAAVVNLEGNVDFSAEEPLKRVYTAASFMNPERVILNFSRVSYINSSGIALLIELLREVHAVNRSLAAYGLTDHFRHIFEVTRLAEYIPVFEDQSSALKNIRNHTETIGVENA